MKANPADSPGHRRVPALAWIVAAVVAAHAFFFWLVSGGHYLPKVSPAPRGTPPDSFASGIRTSTDPLTGETITERQFVVSTHLALPSPTAPPPPPPQGGPARDGSTRDHTAIR